MLKRLILAAALIFVSMQSQAATALLCSKAHIPAYYFAERVDAINETGNKKILKTELMSVVSKDNSELPFFQKWRARSYAKKVSKFLTLMKDAKGWDDYDRGVFAYKLEKLAFLADPTVLKEMSVHERLIYRQAQHTALMEGLKNSLFDGKPVPPSVLKKVWRVISFPLHPMMSRWYFAMVSMPKLRGAAMPPELAMNVLWNGVAANREALKPYMANVYFKSYFNVFSSVYRGVVVAALVGGGSYVGYAFYNGDQIAMDMLSPLKQDAAKMSEMNFSEWAGNRDLEYMIDEFKANMGRPPTDDEIAQLKIFLQSQKSGAAQDAASSPAVKPAMPSIVPEESGEIKAPDWVQAAAPSNATDKAETGKQGPTENEQPQALPSLDMIQANPQPSESEPQLPSIVDPTEQPSTSDSAKDSKALEKIVDPNDWIQAGDK